MWRKREVWIERDLSVEGCELEGKVKDRNRDKTVVKSIEVSGTGMEDSWTICQLTRHIATDEFAMVTLCQR